MKSPNRKQKQKKTYPKETKIVSSSKEEQNKKEKGLNKKNHN